jgi:PleD family two-component response regulator
VADAAIPSYSHSLETERSDKSMENKGTGATDPQIEKLKSNTSQFSSAVILVVDDDPFQRYVIQTILSDEGYQAYVASSAEEALKAAKTLKPDVVLTDLRMYKMDGIKLMEKLRSQKCTAH